MQKKLDSSTIMLGFIAILFGLGGTYALRQYLQQEPPPVAEAPAPPRPPQKLTVPLASRNIRPGTKITLDDVALYKMTREEIKKTLKVQSFMTNPDQILGKLVLNPIKKGKTFNTEDFYPQGSGPGIAKRIPPGLRAITIMMEPTGALIGFAGPGQHVDVLFHYGEEGSVAGNAGAVNGANGANNGNTFFPAHHLFNPPRNRDYFGNTLGGSGSGLGTSRALQNATVTLVQDAEIMALGRDSTPNTAARGLPQTEKIPVTLAVTPRDAEVLRVASGHGELSLTMRAPKDARHVALADPVTLEEIINVRKESHQMVIHRGKSVSRLNFGGGSVIESRAYGAQQAGNAPDKKQDAQQNQTPALNVVAPFPYWLYPPNPNLNPPNSKPTNSPEGASANRNAQPNGPQGSPQISPQSSQSSPLIYQDRTP